MSYKKYQLLTFNWNWTATSKILTENYQKGSAKCTHI